MPLSLVITAVAQFARESPRNAQPGAPRSSFRLLAHAFDGIYTEHGDNPGALTAAALMGMRKPVLAWTYKKTLNQPDPDSFFQRHLHLGVYPTAPYPFNHHCINPDPAAGQFHLDYGPPLDALRGKKWVLAARCVETVTRGAKVNLFQVEKGYALPVTFGGGADSAIVRVRNIPGMGKLRCEAFHPGVQMPVPVSSSLRAGELKLQVPLKRGCAMVMIVTTAKE
jgi:hypothetical protein